MRRRRWILLAVAAIAILALTPIGATAAPGTARSMRWDLTQILPGPNHIMPGATDVATVPAGQPFAGDTVSVTGTGQFNVAAATASGGGTFIHRRGATIIQQGVYVVTRFVSFQRVTPNGSLQGLGLIDTIGPLQDARSGILRLRVKGIGADGSVIGRATLFVHCHLPGAPDIGEGIRLIVDGGPRFTTITSGLTLFHILR